jgi:hypothetical protein
MPIPSMKAALTAATLIIGATVARADVIAGPALPFADGWAASGLEFQALSNTTLTSFVFQNQGKADTVVLTDTAGNILHSQSIPAAVNSYTANVN